MKGAPLIDKDDDEVGTQFINKFITCELPDDPELCNKLRENLLIIRLLLARKVLSVISMLLGQCQKEKLLQEKALLLMAVP